MQQSIHPKYNQANVTCVCGAAFQVGSTLTDIAVDICSNCHPFFTNEMRFVDRKGRVDAFQKAQSRAQDLAATRTTRAKKAREEQKSYQEILQDQKTKQAE